MIKSICSLKVCVLMALFAAFTHASAKELDPSKKLRSATIYVNTADSDNLDNGGLIYNSNESTGTLIIRKMDGSDIRIGVKIVATGLGATAFVAGLALDSDMVNEIGIKNLKNNRIADIFEAPFVGVNVGLSFTMGFGTHVLANTRGLFFVDTDGSLISAGVDLSLATIEIFPLDFEQYNAIKDIVLK
jgi:hypothetical protein